MTAEVLTFGVIITPDFLKIVLSLVLLIVIDLIAGVALAVKLGLFEWKRLADFYRSKMPLIILWAVVDCAIRLAVFYQLPFVDIAQPVLEGLAIAPVLISIGAQILSKVQIIRGDIPPETDKAKG